ncbi:MAG: 30S ribosomal protein S24e [Candidatus Micrarchaeia archaeon]
MDFEIREKKENKLLDRTEVDAVVSFEGATPPVADMRDMIVQKMGCNPDLMVIRKVEPGFGKTEVALRAHIYKTPERMKEIEEEYVLKRNKIGEKEEKKEEAEPEGEKKEESKPEEEKKEEKPPEEKEEAPQEKPKEEPAKEEKKEEPEEKKEEKPPE